MRKLSSGNKRMFVLFTIIVIAIIVLLLVNLSMVFNVNKEEYQTSKDSFIYDENYDHIELEQEGTIQQKWNGKYYLKVGEEQYSLGNKNIVYDTKKKSIELIGKMFEVNKNGDIVTYEDYNTIENTKEDKFFKIDDRKYLVISNSIQNENKTLNTKNYLIVVLDKQGNTMLMNDEINSKTINPLIISTSSYKFDVANEKLIYDKEEIDLKKVIGSTNEYTKKSNTIENNTNQTNTIQNIVTNEISLGTAKNTTEGSLTQSINGIAQNGNTTAQTTNDTATGTNTTTTGSNYIGVSGIIQQASTSGTNSNSTSSTTENKVALLKNVSLRGVNAKSTYIDVNYAVVDPENLYQTVYLDVKGEKEIVIALDKSASTYRISDLSPNTQYSIILGCKEITTGTSTRDRIEDVISVKTSKIEDSLKITKIASGKIYYNFVMDSNFVYDSAKIALYVDNNKVTDTDVDINQAISSSGFTSSFEYKYGSTITIQLESVMYDGKELDKTLKATMKNY